MAWHGSWWQSVQWRGDGWWQEDSRWETRGLQADGDPEKEKEQDRRKDRRFANCGTLGTKHPLPLDDRKDLLLVILQKMQEVVSSDSSDSGVGGSMDSSFRVAISGWNAVVTHAALFYLCKVRPGMPLRALRNEDGKFSVVDAARILYGAVRGLYPAVDDQKEALDFLQATCWERTPELVKKATDIGFDPWEMEDKLVPKPREDSRNGMIARSQHPDAASPSTSGRRLLRMTTDEELTYLTKKREVLQMRKDVAQQEEGAEASMPYSPPVRQPGPLRMRPGQEEALLPHLPQGMRLLPKVAEACGVLRPSTSGAASNDPQPPGSGPQAGEQQRKELQAALANIEYEKKKIAYLLEGAQPPQESREHGAEVEAEAAAMQEASEQREELANRDTKLVALSEEQAAAAKAAQEQARVALAKAEVVEMREALVKAEAVVTAGQKQEEEARLEAQVVATRKQEEKARLEAQAHRTRGQEEAEVAKAARDESRQQKELAELKAQAGEEAKAAKAARDADQQQRAELARLRAHAQEEAEVAKAARLEVEAHRTRGQQREELARLQAHAQEEVEVAKAARLEVEAHRTRGQEEEALQELVAKAQEDKTAMEAVVQRLREQVAELRAPRTKSPGEQEEQAQHSQETEHEASGASGSMGLRDPEDDKSGRKTHTISYY